LLACLFATSDQYRSFLPAAQPLTTSRHLGLDLPPERLAALSQDLAAVSRGT
jgi:hypothetical protein